MSDDINTKREKEKRLEDIQMPTSKRGYLFKWQDRQTGWGETKWSLRFVVIENGRLAYYGSHHDLTPRYVLDLKGFAVQDDGPKNAKGSTYYIFTIYQKPTLNQSLIKKEQEKESLEKKNEDEQDESRMITPLLRFSTESIAEKNLWMDVITDSCAFRESHNSNKLTTSVFMKPKPAMPPPTASEGTIPPIYYAQPVIAKKFRRQSKIDSSKTSKLKQRKAYPPSKPMHRMAEPSYLSTECERPQNYRGFLNLALIILVISNLRVLIDTISRYGSVFSKVPHVQDVFLQEKDSISFTLAVVTLPHIFLIFCFIVERLLASNVVSESVGMTLHFINCAGSIITPIMVIWSFLSSSSPLISSLLLVQNIITWMCIVSYCHANQDYRTSLQDTNKATQALVKDLDDAGMNITYPKNITLGNLYYFWFAPTLTYQIAFPRSKKIRWSYICSLLLKFFICTTIMSYLIGQVTVPTLDFIIQDFGKVDDTNDKQIWYFIDKQLLAVEYLLKLSIGNTYIWLLFFYSFFDLFLNFLAELTRFGDRVFYKDWWNASELASFWRLWNMPVHYWCVRHLYFPCLRSGISKSASNIIVFFFSAVLHEVLASVPFHLIRVWAFLGMMAQVPLATITVILQKKNPASSIGNVIFWVSFCIVGQPMGISLYAIDYWRVKNGCEWGYCENSN